MATMEHERITQEEARNQGVDRLLGTAAKRPVRVETEQGSFIILPVGVIDEELDALDDLYDLLLLVVRMQTDSGERHDLEDVIAELGITEEEIAAAAD